MEDKNTLTLVTDISYNWEDAPPATQEQIEAASQEAYKRLFKFLCDRFDDNVLEYINRLENNI